MPRSRKKPRQVPFAPQAQSLDLMAGHKLTQKRSRQQIKRKNKDGFLVEQSKNAADNFDAVYVAAYMRPQRTFYYRPAKNIAKERLHNFYAK